MHIRLSELKKIIRDEVREVAGIGPAGASSTGGIRAFWTVAPQLNISSEDDNVAAEQPVKKRKNKNVLRRGMR